MKQTLNIPVFILIIIALVSCDHKELCFNHPHTAHVSVVFDWSCAPEAEINKEVESMCLWFYPTDVNNKTTGEPIYYNIADIHGGEIEIPVGYYQILFYNNDYERVLFRGVNDFLMHECYTKPTSVSESLGGNLSTKNIPCAEGTEDQPIVNTPDKMWGDNAMNVHITGQGISYSFIRDGETEITNISNDNNIITLMPHEQTCNYTVKILNVENLKYASKVSASLSSMSGSVFCAEERLTTDKVVLPIEVTSDKKSIISGTFQTFGQVGLDERHILTVYAWMTDGKGYYGTVDVTEQVDNAPDYRHVHIVVDGFKLPKPITNGGGLQPNVDEWESVDVDIEM